MLLSYKKTMLVMIFISFVLLLLINYYYYEVAEQAFKFQMFNHSDPSKNYIHDNVLINYTGFKFIINPRVCKRLHTDLFVIVTVPSSASNFDKRRAIRQTWGRWDDDMKVVFFIGIPESNLEEETRRIRSESALYGDIVQGNFIDGYKNLSYKHVMILKWVAQHCADAKFVLKVDDDVVVDLYRMYGLLEEYRWGRTGVMVCYKKTITSVVRNFKGWMISLQDYEKQFYPPYCSGYTIVYSSDVVLKLLEASRRVPYFFIEDVYVTGFLAKEAGVTAVEFDIPMLYNEQLAKLLISNPSRLLGEGPYILGPSLQDARKIRNFWIPLQRYNFKIEKLNRKRNVTFYNVVIPVRRKTKTLKKSAER